MNNQFQILNGKTSENINGGFNAYCAVAFGIGRDFGRWLAG